MDYLTTHQWIDEDRIRRQEQTALEYRARISRARANADHQLLLMWDRFDITAAYYHFIHAKHWQPLDLQAREKLGKYKWHKARQLDRLRYKPGLSDRQLATISPNAKAIYRRLIHRHLGIHSTAPLAQCRVCGAIQQERDTARCYRCNAHL